MVLKEYTNLYPRKLFVAVCDDRKDVEKLVKAFVFYKISEGFGTCWDGDATEILLDWCRRAAAFCVPVERKEDHTHGVLCVIPDIKAIDTETMAHEAVHITDYFYETLSMDAQEYSEGNEPYAYLVGWAAENIHKTCREYETKLRRVKGSMGNRKNGSGKRKKRSVQSTDEQS
jgi:hypothetical protein